MMFGSTPFKSSQLLFAGKKKGRDIYEKAMHLFSI